MNEVESTIFNSEITEEDILKSGKDLKESKSPGQDDVPTGVFIHIIDILLPLLSRVFDRVFETREFPMQI